ncbi:hypothetical protein FB451DRAFT_1567882 [Mycena latifolia]|nr:hypothetical protein FB451DRAFT_1567882 [Mycena latifolia]
MDDEPDLNAVVNDTGPAPYAGAFFPNSQNLRIQGGVFTSYVTNITQVPPSLPSGDFRMIPMGDIDLRQQIRLDGETRVVDFLGSRRGGVRRMYTAKIAGSKSNMTVALYEGGSAEEAWRRDFTAYSNIRHPNVFQIYGAARSNEIHATIIHGDLIPLEHVWKLYRHSHFAATYMLAYCSTEFQEAEKYCDLLLQTRVSYR